MDFIFLLLDMHYLDHSKCCPLYNSTHEMMLDNESIDELNENNEFTR